MLSLFNRQNDIELPFLFDDLIPDDQLYTFENLEPRELLSLCEASDRFAALAQHIFADKYSDETIEISDALPSVEEVFIDRRGVILIDDHELALRIFEQFGHLIRKLAIRYSSENIHEIIESISLHCADELIELEVDSFHVNLFNKMEKPFKNVKTLHIVGHFNSVEGEQLSFVELFPSLSDLSLNYLEIMHPNSILVEIATLRHIHINANQFSSPNHIRESQFLDLLRRNSQINSLKLDYGTRDLLKKINKIVPKLQSLELVNHNSIANLDDDDSIAFEHVENFTIAHSFESAPPNVDFPNLVEFHSIDCKAYSNEWINLVQKSRHLEKLFIGSTSIFNEQIEKLAIISSNLSEIYLETQAVIRDETIVELIRNSPKLMKMFITFYVDNGYSYELVAQLIRNEFGHRFSVNDCDYELIVESLLQD